MTLLVVEDDESIADLLEDLFEGNMEVVRARDGQEALEHARQNAPDVALVDIRLPKVDGFQVAERLRKMESCRSARIFMMSTHATLLAEASRLPVDGILLKPLDPERVIRTVRTVAGLG